MLVVVDAIVAFDHPGDVAEVELSRTMDAVREAVARVARGRSRAELVVDLRGDDVVAGRVDVLIRLHQRCRRGRRRRGRGCFARRGRRRRRYDVPYEHEVAVRKPLDVGTYPFRDDAN